MRRAAACLLALVAASACGGGSAAAPTTPSPLVSQVPGAARLASDYLNEVVNVMQANSINRARIDWTDFRNQVFQRATGAQTIADLYPAISFALGLLDDHHSFYQAAAGGGIGNPRSPRCAGITAAAVIPPPDIGYLRVTAFSSTTPGADRAFADGIQDQIRGADRANLAGWIVDVRGNGGGNMWPMVAGVGPVLGEGTAGYFIPPAGTPVDWSFRGGASFSGATEIVRTTTAYALRTTGVPRVAVLTDNLVASSGEAVVVSFRARPNARSFGSATCGLSTANSGFRLSDGSTLQLTTALMADRAGNSYGVPIVPDEAVSESEVVRRAIDWLHGE
jgi:peptidase S41-like protein